MFAALGRRTALLATRRAAQTQQATKRRMGGAAAAPEWTGIDKVVRGYFPQDDQRKLFIFCLCGWVDIYFSFCNPDVCYIIKNGCYSVLIYINVKEYSLYIYLMRYEDILSLYKILQLQWNAEKVIV